MRRRRKVRLTMALALFTVSVVCAQTQGSETSFIDLTELNTDVNTLFTSIGRDIAPALHQIAISGNDLVGEARLHGLTRCYLVVGTSATTVDGVGKVLASTDEDTWKFDFISIPNIIRDNFGDEGSTGGDAYHMATERTMAFPSVRIGFGFPLPFGLEFLGNGFYLPGFLSDQIINLGGDDFKTMDPRFEMLTLGGTLRKVILSEARSKKHPNLSIGVSYLYSHFLLSVDNFSLDSISDSPVTIGEGADGGTLNMDGKLGFETTVHSFGVVLGISKTLLYVFIPYAKAAMYYHLTEYSSTFKVNAVVTNNTDNSTEASAELDAPVDLELQDVSFIVGTGMEFRLFPITLHTGVSMDLERPIVDIDSFSLNGFTLNGVQATVSLRLQI